MRIRKGVLFGVVVLVALVLAVAFINRMAVRDLVQAWTAPVLPSAQPHVTSRVSVTPAHGVTLTSTPLPAQVNLAVPFVPQAPFQVWDSDHEEFCEEAASLMAVAYINGDTSVRTPAVAEADLQSIKNWERTTFGFFEDTTAAQTARIITDKYHIEAVRVVRDPTVNQITTWLAQRRVVLVPAAGRMLGNPNFTGVGPLYHMVVLKGYTAGGQLITNDPGTRRGADYLYPVGVIMNAMHDWNNGDVNNGAKVVIVVG